MTIRIRPLNPGESPIPFHEIKLGGDMPGVSIYVLANRNDLTIAAPAETIARWGKVNLLERKTEGNRTRPAFFADKVPAPEALATLDDKLAYTLWVPDSCPPRSAALMNRESDKIVVGYWPLRGDRVIFEADLPRREVNIDGQIIVVNLAHSVLYRLHGNETQKEKKTYATISEKLRQLGVMPSL